MLLPPTPPPAGDPNSNWAWFEKQKSASVDFKLRFSTGDTSKIDHMDHNGVTASATWRNAGWCLCSRLVAAGLEAANLFWAQECACRGVQLPASICIGCAGRCRVNFQGAIGPAGRCRVNFPGVTGPAGRCRVANAGCAVMASLTHCTVMLGTTASPWPRRASSYLEHPVDHAQSGAEVTQVGNGYCF